jgi:hypothetical protein
MAGLDPAIQSPRSFLDGRLKAGHDECWKVDQVMLTDTFSIHASPVRNSL